MAILQISIAASRPALVYHSKPNLSRSLVFLVHHRSSSQRCPFPPSPPNQPWIQYMAQGAVSNGSKECDHIIRAHPWEKSKPAHNQWIRNQRTLVNDWLNVSSAKRYKNSDSAPRNDWIYNALDATHKVNSIHKSLFRSLDIMSKSYVRRGTRPNQSPTVKTWAQARTSLFKTGSHERCASVKPQIGTVASVPQNTIPGKNQELDASIAPKSEPLVSLDARQDNIQPIVSVNPELVSHTPNTLSSPEIGELKEFQKEVTKIATGDAGPLGSNEPVRTVTSSGESTVEINDLGNPSKLSPADLIASLRYYDRKRGTLPDEEPLSAEDVATLESSRNKLTKARKSVAQPNNNETTAKNSTWKAGIKKIGLTLSSMVVGAYIFGVGTKLLSVQPESTAAAELLSAVQRSKGRME